MEFDMAEDFPSRAMEYRFNDDTKSLSSLSSAYSTSTLDSANVFEDNILISPSKKEPGTLKSSNSPTTVLLEDHNSPRKETAHKKEKKRIIPLSSGEQSNEGCSDEKWNHDSKAIKSEPCNVSFGLDDDDWTTQGNRTEKTGTTGGTSFYTGRTDATGATKLHQNGVSAMLHRKLRKNKSSKSNKATSPVPTSINTIRRPMSFDNQKAINCNNLVAPSQIKRRISYQKIYSTTKLKDDPAVDNIEDECNFLCVNDDDSTRSAIETVAEDGDYHAGSKSISGFIRNMFQCCHAGNVVGFKQIY